MNYTISQEASKQVDLPIEVDTWSVYRAFEQVLDGRHKRGVRYSVALILTLIVLAKLAGMTTPLAIAEWVRLRAGWLRQVLPGTRESFPCAATYSNVLRAVDAEQVNEVVTQLLTRVGASKRCGDEPSRLLGQADRRGRPCSEWVVGDLVQEAPHTRAIAAQRATAGRCTASMARIVREFGQRTHRRPQLRSSAALASSRSAATASRSRGARHGSVRYSASRFSSRRARSGFSSHSNASRYARARPRTSASPSESTPSPKMQGTRTNTRFGWPARGSPRPRSAHRSARLPLRARRRTRRRPRSRRRRSRANRAALRPDSRVRVHVVGGEGRGPVVLVAARARPADVVDHDQREHVIART